MSWKDKLLARLQDKPKDFTWKEAITLMRKCGFELLKGSGSRRKFVSKEDGQIVSIHEPHPQNTLKIYQLDLLIEGLKRAGEIKGE